MNKVFGEIDVIICYLIKKFKLVKKTIHQINLPKIINFSDKLLLEDPYFPEDEKIKILEKYPEEISYQAIDENKKTILFTIRKISKKEYDCAIVDNFGRYKFI